MAAPDGSTSELELLADTGSPYAIVISRQDMIKLKAGDGPDVNTNFGPLEGGWLQPAMRELGLVRPVLGYASDAVVAATKASHPNFEGLAGLPLLTLAEYGGNADWFWLRIAGSPP